MNSAKFALFLFIVSAGIKAGAQTRHELEQKREQYNRQLEQLNREYRETVNNKKSSLKQLDLLRRQINIRGQKINSINSEVRLLNNQISADNTSIHNLQSQLDLLKKQYSAMILFAYHNRNSYNKLMFIFAAKDFNQSYSRLKYMQDFNGYLERQAKYIEGAKKDLNSKINVLDSAKNEKNDALADQVKERVTLGQQKEDESGIVAELSKHQGEIAKQQRDLRRKINRISLEIKNAIRLELARKRAAAEKAARTGVANKPTKKVNDRPSDFAVLTAAPEDAKLSSNFVGNKGHLPWPVANGVITVHMGMYKIESIRTESDGIAIKTIENAPVRAIFEGRVEMIRNILGTYTVVVGHGAYLTAYSNLKTVNVMRGQKLSTGQLIGIAAHEETSGGPAVLFSIYKGTEPVGPEAWLTRQRK